MICSMQVLAGMLESQPRDQSKQEVDACVQQAVLVHQNQPQPCLRDHVFGLWHCLELCCVCHADTDVSAT